MLADWLRNERTLFTFLAGQDDSPIAPALNRSVSSFGYVLPHQVYDYFEYQLSQCQDDQLKDVWIKVTNAIESLSERCDVETHILKTIGAFHVASHGSNLRCTLEMLWRYAVPEAGFDDALRVPDKSKPYLCQPVYWGNSHH